VPYSTQMTILQDVRYAARLLVRDPWFTLVAALALGLGIGLNTTVFTFVNAVLIRGLPFDSPGELLYVTKAHSYRPIRSACGSIRSRP